MELDSKNILFTIQQNLIAPKGQYNQFGNFKYRSCEDILEALKEPLSKVEAYVTISDEVVNVGERYYIKATAKLQKNCEVIASETALARETLSKKGMDDSQITGAASSYARKYALSGLFAIDDNNDADAPSDPDRITLHNQAVRKHFESISAIKLALAEENFDWAAECFSEIPDEDRQALGLASTKGGIFTLEETKLFKDERWREARKRYITSKNEE